MDNLVWIAYDGEILTGQKVLDYFTSEVKAMEDDLQAYMKRNEITPIAPYEPRYVDGKLETADAQTDTRTTEEWLEDFAGQEIMP